MRPFAAALPFLLALSACGPRGHDVPGDSNDHRPFSAIAADETVHFTDPGTGWSGEVVRTTLTYRTAAKPKGETVAVARFAGRGGLSFGGTLDGRDLLIVFTPGGCTDGATKRAYPFVATLQLGQETRQGCAWTDRRPFTEGKGA